MQSDLIGAVQFRSFDASKIEKIGRLFAQHILNKEFFDNLRQNPATHSGGRQVRIRVGNFNLDSSFIYFYVEGDPYLQTIELDATGNLFVHLDEWSVDSPPHAKDYPHAIKRIEENGSWFLVKNGKLLKEAS